jgi:hypothetical protein
VRQPPTPESTDAGEQQGPAGQLERLRMQAWALTC